MPYYAVYSGNVFRCVVADDELSACVHALNHHINDPAEDHCSPGQSFYVVEHGKSTMEALVILSDCVQLAGGFTITEPT